jgi:hypothetical protein
MHPAEEAAVDYVCGIGYLDPYAENMILRGTDALVLVNAYSEDNERVSIPLSLTKQIQGWEVTDEISEEDWQRNYAKFGV